MVPGGYPQLQWGRNFLVTEIAGVLGGACRQRVLQWGRNFLVTEMECPKPAITEHFKLLQWGRNFLVTEIAKNPLTGRLPCRASMGP